MWQIELAKRTYGAHHSFFCATVIMGTTVGKTEIHSSASKLQLRRGNTQIFKIDLVFIVHVYLKQGRLNPVPMKIYGSLHFEFAGYCSEPFALLWIECGGFPLKRHKGIV